jgi:antitoxin component of RelBE/YafQ-DinJ toxin-antitoxin module
MTTILHIKTDKKVRDQVEKLAKTNGMTITALVNISLRSLINKPILELDLAPALNAKTKKAMLKAQEDRIAGNNFSGPFTTVKALKTHLEK